jgi:tRNA (cmo5U34)-methyltransferase
MLSEMELSRFYKDIPNWIDSTCENLRLLDLGCGTGLELEGLFEKYPGIQVTGIDLSPKMLERLREKFPGKDINLLCGSYFDVSFDEGASESACGRVDGSTDKGFSGGVSEGTGRGFDVVLSVYSLHHFTEGQKLSLYQKIRRALKPGGVFINGDFIVATQELQDLFMEHGNRLRAEYGIGKNELYHIDTPLTGETEIRLLIEAGFSSTKVLHQETYASVIVAQA